MMPGFQALTALRFTPLLPVGALVALVVVAIAVIALALWRRARGTAGRLIGFSLILFWLAGPHLVSETRQELPDIALVVLDDSLSMTVGDRAALREQARAAIEAQSGSLPGLQLRMATVSSGPEHDGTHLFAAINRALADIPKARLAGIIAVTDAQIQDIPPASKDALPAPLHVLLPAAGEQTDRRIRLLEAPAYGLIGQSVTVKFTVDDLGTTGQGTAKVTLRHDNDPPTTLMVPTGQEQSIDLAITHAGSTVVELAADPLPGEVSFLNNRAVMSINGVRDRLNVLLISGQPHAGERTWRRLLKADPAVDLVHFTILRPPEKDDMTPLNELALIAFPVRELFQVKIRSFDLIILDRFENRNILPAQYLANIADYVRNGGALLLSVGPEFAGPDSLANGPLANILPALPRVGMANSYGADLTDNSSSSPGVDENPFRPRVTTLGDRHPVTENLPGAHDNTHDTAHPGAPSWGSWYRRILTDNAHGQSLMSGPDGAPLLLLDRVGAGRIALLLSDQIWLWSRGHQGGGPQAELLRRISHWLLKEPELEEEALVAHIAGGDLVIERRSVASDPASQVTITDPEGRQTQLMLKPVGTGKAQASFPATNPGLWQVSDGEHMAYAALTPPDPVEISDLRVTATTLGDLAHETGGGQQWLKPDGTPKLRWVEPEHSAEGPGWIGLRRNHAHLVTGVASHALLPGWLVLPLVVVALFWGWRREGG